MYANVCTTYRNVISDNSNMNHGEWQRCKGVELVYAVGVQFKINYYNFKMFYVILMKIIKNRSIEFTHEKIRESKHITFKSTKHEGRW